ncbi:hypothetical protein LSG31_06800 [Fodinisporobacter ferrooxydans]|uniref:Uncharacterized protein n=1 Tax=Fodinisporobacter ferrooxydans TaxID=2901836 RepID=A0ABY4CNG1_9BACL|nr:hypothetical protein LSG31_06800 [Alicyclobacillaceae bacterium MYW30-H2]
MSIAMLCGSSDDRIIEAPGLSWHGKCKTVDADGGWRKIRRVPPGSKSHAARMFLKTTGRPV